MTIIVFSADDLLDFARLVRVIVKRKVVVSGVSPQQECEQRRGKNWAAELFHAAMRASRAIVLIARGAFHLLFIRAINVSAIVAGVSATAMPAAFNASIFPAAVPFPPETIAPACPIRRPGGAVSPAINAATGFLQLFLIHSAAASSAEPPISPIKIIASVSRSSLKSLTASRCDRP